MSRRIVQHVASQAVLAAVICFVGPSLSRRRRAGQFLVLDRLRLHQKRLIVGTGNALFTATNTGADTNDVDGGESLVSWGEGPSIFSIVFV